MVWYSHLFQNFPQFIVLHTVKGFGIVNKAEINVFLELSCFFHDPADVGNLISGSSAFSKTSLNIRECTVHIFQDLKQLNRNSLTSTSFVKELYKKDLNNLDNHNDVITHLEPDILECEVKWALGSITMSKASGLMEFQLSYFTFYR